MKKFDYIFALITGEIVALYFINLFKEIFSKNAVFGSILWSLTIVFPILAAACLKIAYLIGKRFLFVFQLAKFLLVGALATIFDLGSLSIFIKFFGATAGLSYAMFKGISFIIATSTKYFVDKFWAFEKKETIGMGKEFIHFFVVTIIGLGVNVGVASAFVNILKPQAGISAEVWANLGGIAAVLFTFAWNFLGYKFIVFKK